MAWEINVNVAMRLEVLHEHLKYLLYHYLPRFFENNEWL